MTYHILNGGALAFTFDETKLQGEQIICRECLVDGPVDGESLEELFTNRAEFLSPHDKPAYFSDSAGELEKVLNIPEGSDVYLWFEDDLFCQVNMWFIIYLLSLGASGKKIYRVFAEIPAGKDHWNGFGLADAASLEKAFQNNVPFSEEDLDLGLQLWKAYQQNDRNALQRLSVRPSAAFSYLPEVVQAQLDRFPEDGSPGRPQKVILKLLEKGFTTFPELFPAFFKEEGIYGFGDSQVKPIYDEVLKGRK